VIFRVREYHTEGEKSMKKTFVIFVGLLLCVSMAFAATFSPSVLKISAPSKIQYNFDGTDLKIPVTVTGSQANVIFLVFTNGKASSIQKVQNGYLGWHYVNKIDTSIYISTLLSLDRGNNVVSWDGKDQDGKAVPAGDYTYYLWGFDNVNAKTPVYTANNYYPSRNSNFVEFGPDGKALERPIFFAGTNKWIIGNDPADDTFRETTDLGLPEKFGNKEKLNLHPTDHNYFYYEIGNDETGYLGVWKFQRVPNGQSIHVES